jgi:hypothetical protein
MKPGQKVQTYVKDLAGRKRYKATAVIKEAVKHANFGNDYIVGDIKVEGTMKVRLVKAIK